MSNEGKILNLLASLSLTDQQKKVISSAASVIIKNGLVKITKKNGNGILYKVTASNELNFMAEIRISAREPEISNQAQNNFSLFNSTSHRFYPSHSDEDNQPTITI